MFEMDRKKLLVVGGAVLVIVVLFLVRQNSNKQNLINQALQEFSQASSMAAYASLSLDLPPVFNGQERPFNNIELKLDGDLSKDEEGASQFAGVMSAEARGRGNAFFTEGDLIVMSDTVSFRLTEFPALLDKTRNLVEKWTQVETSLLQTDNEESVNEAIAILSEIVTHQGKEAKEDVRAEVFSGQPTPEQEQKIADAFRRSNSGNAALQQISTLLDANDISKLSVAIDPVTKEFVEIVADFVQPAEEGEESTHVATLSLSFTDYNKETGFEEPEIEATVRPEVFGRLFNSEQLEGVEAE